MARSGMGPSNEPFPACRFYVRLDKVDHAVFTEMSGLQIELDILPIEEGGNNTTVHKLPGRVKSGQLTLKRGVSKMDKLWQWMYALASGTVETRNVSVVLMDPTGAIVHQWDFTDAFPVKWSCSSFRADSNEVAMEELQLAYGGMQLAR